MLASSVLCDSPKKVEERPFQCGRCDEKYFSRSVLKRHEKIHSGEKPFKCGECGKEFHDRGNLINHSKTHNEREQREVFPCNYCPKKYLSQAGLSNHTKTHTGEFLFPCDECDKKYTNSLLLKYHKRIHTGEKPFECSICNKRFAYREVLRRHTNIHTGEKPYECDQCSKKFSDLGNFKTHTKTHKDREQRAVFTCNYCPKTYLSQGGLSDHTKTHTEESLFPCDECGKKFTKSIQLLYHKRIHTGEKPFECDICNKRFGYQQVLKKHMRIHTGEKPYECDHCGRKFSDGGNFDKHMKRHNGEKSARCRINHQIQNHFKNRRTKCAKNSERIGGGRKNAKTDIKREPCEVFTSDNCSIQYLSQSELSEHTKSHTGESSLPGNNCGENQLKYESLHTGEKPFECNICNQRFGYREVLKKHMRIHTGEKPYECHQCGKKFSDLGNFKTHTKTHKDREQREVFTCNYCPKKYLSQAGLSCHTQTHTGEFLFPCDECDKKYTNSLLLKYHKRVHTGEKPYGCNICNKRFGYRFVLNKHLQIHTSEKPYECHQCGKKFSDGCNLDKHMKRHNKKKSARSRINHETPNHCNDRRMTCAKNSERLRRGKWCSCFDCMDQFSRRCDFVNTLSPHLVTRLENDSHICKLCGKKFQDENYFIEHRTRMHKHDSVFICTHCGQKFVISCKSGKLIMVHSDKYPVDCRQCCDIFSSRIVLNRDVPPSRLRNNIDRSSRYECIFNRNPDSVSRTNDRVFLSQKLEVCKVEECESENETVDKNLNWKEKVVNGALSDQESKVDVKQEKVENCDEYDIQNAKAFDIIDPLELQNIMQAVADSSNIVETDLTDSNDELETTVSYEEERCVQSDTDLTLAKEVADHKAFADEKFVQQRGEISNSYSLNKPSNKKAGKKPFSLNLHERTISRRKCVKRHSTVDQKNETRFCKCCEKNCLGLEEWRIHKQKWTEKLLCDLCGEDFFTLCKLECHNKKYHTEVKPYACDQCSNTFTYKKTFEQHYKNHSRMKPHHCDQCNKSFRAEENLAMHTLRMHNPVGDTFTCSYCGKCFKSRQRFTIHEKHHTNKSNPCDQCPKTFLKKCFRDRHIAIFHGRSLSDFSCNFCSRTFELEEDCLRHRKVHTGVNVFTCDQCKKECSSLYILNVHMKVHRPPGEEREKLHACDHCSRRFESTSNLKIHMRKHTGEKPFICEICSKQFANPHNLSSHKTLHTGEKPFACELCSKTFRTKYQCAEHLRRHNGEKRYCCEYCDWRFVAKVDCKRHQMTHSGERPFTCIQCNLSFAQRSTLTGHMRSHTGEKPETCSVCNNSFCNKFNLNIHMRIHTGEKPYCCTVCNKTFRDNGDLKKHQRVHSDVKHYKCDECGREFRHRATLNSHRKTHILLSVAQPPGEN